MKWFASLLGLLFAVLFLPNCTAQEQPLGEDAKIEALIAAVEKLDSAKFDRNGSEYDAKTAARFLRGKWNSNKAEIKTARDFIEKAGTGSSTSGKPYLIKFKDGDKKCADFLKEELTKLESPKKKD
jgi:hypothetical protein